MPVLAAWLPWCWLSAAYSAPQNSADQKSLHHHYQIPRAGAKCGKLFFCCCLCLSVQCASPLFQQSFFSFLIFFRLPKFLSSYIIHLEEAIHLKSFYLYIPIFLDPLIKKISISSVFSKVVCKVEKNTAIIFNLHKVLSLNVLKYKIKLHTYMNSFKTGKRHGLKIKLSSKCIREFPSK